MKRELSKLMSVYDILTPKIRAALDNLPEMEKMSIQEIRLRAGKSLALTLYSKEYCISMGGTLMSEPNNSVVVTAEDIDYTYNHSFQNSLHSFQREITRGYITVGGGCRVGFCGTAMLNPSDNYRVMNVKNISSVNIRVAREVIGCAQELYERTFSKQLSSILIIGPPSSGKTTVLRDLTRIIGSSRRVSVIDERNEIAATVKGIAQNNVGSHTDIFNSYNKYEGIMTAIKVMSPEILVCDEIGSREDLKALQYSVNSGVKLIASCHAADFNEAKQKSVIGKLIKDKVFDYCAVLGTGVQCGNVVDLIKVGGDK